MARPIRPWFRFYVEMPRDPKIRRLVPAHRWVWACVLCAARESAIPGYLLISERIPLTAADLADLAAVRESDARKALAAMLALGLVEEDPHLGCYFVPKFSARQYESDDVTSRTRKHRERSNERTKNSEGTFQRGSRERDRNTPETETDTEEETNVSSSAPADKRRGARLPENWLPSPDLVAAMRAEGIPDELARRELPKFRDYWTAVPGARGRKADWDATWRNWLRRARDDQRPTVPAQREPQVDPDNEWMR